MTARALSLFAAALTGGIAIGAVAWGQVAHGWSVQVAVIASGVVLLALPLVSLPLPLPETTGEGNEPVALGDEPEVALALTQRSGPIIVEVDYRVDAEPDHARRFYAAMLPVQRTRLRSGAFEWSISRDIADPTVWTERFHCPTWGDYLRLRDRISAADHVVQRQAHALTLPGSALVVRRRLERPFGSVRWRSDSPDPVRGPIAYMAP